MRIGLFLSVLGVLATGMPLVPASAVAADLVAHRAAYVIKTGKVRPGGAFSGVGGTMTLNVEKTCDAWLVAQDIDMVMTTTEGESLRQGLRYASWESLDGTHYRFASRNYVGHGEEFWRGEATLDRPGGRGEVQFRESEERAEALPPGTFFPVSHTAWIIDQANAGARQLPHNVFDGADGDGAAPAVLVIGKRVSPPAEESDPLLAQPGWSILLSYFDPESREALPDYEVQAIQLDNGVSTRLLLDYGDFTATMTLDKIEPLPEPDCKG